MDHHVSDTNARTNPEGLFERILAENPELSSLPQTLAQIISLSSDDNASINQLADVIRRDPGLTARMLRAANSPAFGQSRDVGSINKATQLIGFRSALSFALASSVYSLTESLSGELSRPRFWRHALETAVAAKLLAEVMSSPNAAPATKVDPGEAFIAGLLHDIGMLILDNSFSVRYQEIFNEVEAGGKLCTLETEEWGASHAGAGEFILKQWNIPERIAKAVGNHHIASADLRAENDSLSPLDMCVALANTLTRNRMFDRSGDAVERHELRAELIDKLSLSNESLFGIEEKMAEELITQAAYLQIDVGDKNSMLKDANRALYAQYLLVEDLLKKNRELQDEIVREKTEKSFLKSLHAISGSYNHYLNNANATIQGHVQLLQIKASRGEITDPNGVIDRSSEIIQSSVDVMKATLRAIDELTDMRTVHYHEGLEIIDLEGKIAKERAVIEKLSQKLVPAPIES